MVVASWAYGSRWGFFLRVDGGFSDERDPIFSPRAILNNCPYILPDILMLENRLFLTPLERLVAFEKGQLDQKVLATSIDLFFIQLFKIFFSLVFF